MKRQQNISVGRDRAASAVQVQVELVTAIPVLRFNEFVVTVAPPCPAEQQRPHELRGAKLLWPQSSGVPTLVSGVAPTAL